MRRRAKFLPILAAMTAVLVVGLSAIVGADTLNVDTLTTPPQTVDFGTLSLGGSASTPTDAPTPQLSLNCTGQSHADQGAMNFNVSYSAQGVGSTSEVTANPSLTVPSAWPADGNGCGSTADAIGSMPVSVNVPSGAATGCRRFKITVSSTDPDVQNTTETFVTYGVGDPCTTTTNQAPVIDTLGTFSGTEGSDISLSATAHDPDGGPNALTYSWSVDTTGGDLGIGCTITDASNADAAASVKCNDDSNAGTFAVTLSVSDGADTTIGDTTLNVTNVVPVASNAALNVNSYSGAVSASFDFSDDGTNDTHVSTSPKSPYFTWSTDTNHTGSATESNGAGTATDARTLAPGCYTLTVTGKVTDDDLDDSNVLTIASSQTVDIYQVSFLAPMKDGERMLVKYRNVVPVKVQVKSSCNTGLPITSQNLYIRTFKGSDPEDTSAGTEVISTSVSAADSGCQMRVADGFYIYNYATYPSLNAGQDYTLQIRTGAPSTCIGANTDWNTAGSFLIDGVILPKK